MAERAVILYTSVIEADAADLEALRAFETKADGLETSE